MAHNSATKCRSEAVLYLKQMVEYPLSLHIKTIAVFFYELSNKATNFVEILLILDKTPNCPKTILEQSCSFPIITPLTLPTTHPWGYGVGIPRGMKGSHKGEKKN